MRVILLCDELFASREQALVSRIEIGLAAEGHRVVRCIPRTSGADASEKAWSFMEEDASVVPSAGALLTAQEVRFTRPPLWLGRSWTAREILRRLDPAPDAERVDVVHVFGGACWRLGAELAARCGATPALEVWRTGLVERVSSMGVRRPPRGADAQPHEPLFLAPDPGIERALRGAQAGLNVRAAFWGVHAPAAPRQVLRGDRAPAVMVVGSGRDARRFNAAIEGLASCARANPELTVFVDALAARRAGSWAVARRSNLLANLSLIHELEARRDLVLHGDVLVHPEARGEQRTVLLEAMGAGMVVIAAADPGVASLLDGRTARLVHEPAAAAWGAALERALGDPAESASLGRGAWEFIRAQRRVSDHLRAILEAYAWAAGSDAIPIASRSS